MGASRRSRVADTSVNVAEAKRRFSDLLGRVAYAGATVLITRRGKAMARLVPVEAATKQRGLGDLEGWLEDEDPYFGIIEEIARARARHRPRVLGRVPARLPRR